MMLPGMISLVLLLHVTLSDTHVVKRSYTDTGTRLSDRSKSIEHKVVDKLDFDYDSDYDFRRGFSYQSETDSDTDSDVEAHINHNNEFSDDENTSGTATSQQRSVARSRLLLLPLNRRNPKHKKKDPMIHNHACGVHVVQKYFSRNIFSFRVFGPYAWNYQEIVRGQRAERRPFPVSIPLPMLPPKLNMTVTVDRDESMYPFANVYFEYGADSWKSSDSRCEVGGYDRNLADLNWNERRIDCSFACL